MQLPEDYLPEWAKFVIATVLGAGGLHWFRAWLESRRLAKKDFRELLLDRIRELEKTVAHMQTRMGSLRVEMAHIEAENAHFRRKLGLPPRGAEVQDADQQPD
jgi:hypothetical protein